MQIIIKDDIPFEEIYDQIKECSVFFICDSPNIMQWVATNLFQYDFRKENVEKGMLYGKLISDRLTLNYQLSLAFPWGFTPNESPHATLDILRNGNTFPQRRILLFYDAHCVARQNYDLFQSLIKDILFVTYENMSSKSRPAVPFHGVFFLTKESASLLDFLKQESFKDYPLNESTGREIGNFKIIELTEG